MAISRAVEWLARQALITLAYSDQFEFPLTLNEWWQRLIVPQKKVSRGEFAAAVNFLVNNNLIETARGYYFLSSQKQLVSIRAERQRWSIEKHASVDEFIAIVKRIPWIEAVAVTGSLAVENARQESDIDFMIVTTRHRVWLTRLLVVCIASLMRKRRTSRGETPNSWCFNIWIDTDNLMVPRVKQSIYTAYEVFQARWWYDKSEIQKQFYVQNRWAADYIPNAFEVSDVSEPKRFFGGPLAVLNWAVYQCQKLYMYAHLTREIVDYGLAYFHPRDTQRLVYTRWQNALRQSQ